jgi:hypothetical protein
MTGERTHGRCIYWVKHLLQSGILIQSGILKTEMMPRRLQQKAHQDRVEHIRTFKERDMGAVWSYCTASIRFNLP